MTDTSQRPGGANLGGEPVKIDFLYWEGCPSHPKALKLLQKTLEEEGIQAHIDMIKVETEEEAHELQFPGSPTIRVNGFDIVDDPGADIGLTCRVYHLEGRISPLPSRDQLVWALRKAARVPQIDRGSIETAEGVRGA